MPPVSNLQFCGCNCPQGELYDTLQLYFSSFMYRQIRHKHRVKACPIHNLKLISPPGLPPASFVLE